MRHTIDRVIQNISGKENFGKGCSDKLILSLKIKKKQCIKKKFFVRDWRAFLRKCNRKDRKKLKTSDARIDIFSKRDWLQIRQRIRISNILRAVWNIPHILCSGSQKLNQPATSCIRFHASAKVEETDSKAEAKQSSVRYRSSFQGVKCTVDRAFCDHVARKKETRMGERGG